MKTIEKAAEELLAELDKLCLHGANVYLGEDKKSLQVTNCLKFSSKNGHKLPQWWYGYWVWYL